MKVTGKEGGPLGLDQAKKWTANYRGKGNGRIQAHLFGVETVKELLAQEGCVGMRIYYAVNDEGVQQLLLVGTDAEGRDLTDGLILDDSKICPPDCAMGSELAG